MDDTTSNITLTISEIRGDSEFSLHQSVLMDHEYEFYTPWNDLFMDEGTQGSITLTDLNGENKVETGDPLISNVADDDSKMEINFQHPSSSSSPTTASLREILEFVYKETQVEGQEIIPYDEHRIDVNSYDNDIFNPNPDILSEIETSSINSTSSPSLSLRGAISPASMSLKSELRHEKVKGKMSGLYFTPSPTELLQLRNLIENPIDRNERFINGLKHLSKKLKLMRIRTGATAKVIGELEGDQYFLDPSNTVTKLTGGGDHWDLNQTPSVDGIIKPEEGDDHRYAARIVTQTSSSSPSLFDHQYNVRTSAENTLGLNNGSSGHLVSTNSSFIKRTYERNKSFQRYLYVLFSEEVQKLEEQPGATLSVTVYYQNEIFTKSNYKDASHVLKNRRRVAQFPVRVTKLNENESQHFSNKFKIIKPGTFYIPINTGRCRKGQSQSLPSTTRNHQQISGANNASLMNEDLQRVVPPSSPTSETYSDVDICQQPSMTIPVLVKNQTTVNPNPTCVKCHLPNPPPGFGRGDDDFIAWVRCNDPLCQYLVHAACIGFFVNCRKTLNRLPPFFCAAHRSC